MTATPQKYYTLLTNEGKRAIAAAIATDTQVDIKFLALGDGGGENYLPSESQTSLRNQVYQTDAILVSVDPVNPNYIIVETVLPADIGGFFVREMSLKTADGTTIAIGNYPESYKPTLPEGSAVMGAIRFILEVTNASNVTLKIDPSLIFVTKEYVDNSIANHVNQTNVHGGTYAAIPKRLMFRNEDARCQAQDPVEPLDVVNLQTMEDYVKKNSTGSSLVMRPQILSPEDGAIDVPLSLTVTATELAVFEGTAYPISSQCRVRAAGGAIVFDTGVIPYATVFSVNLPDVQTIFEIDMRHYDEYGLWSTWSPLVTVTTADSGILQPSVIYPANKAKNVPYIGLSFQIGELTVLGATAAPLHSRFRYSMQQDMYDAEDTGFIDYTAIFTPPNIEPETQYWWQAQHVDENLGESPWTNLATFTTAEAELPNTADLTHTFPQLVMQGTQKEFTISGAVSVDGGDITYDIPLAGIAGGLSFSKYSGITDGEIITAFIPSIADPYRAASFQIIAKSSYGGQAAPVIAMTTVLSERQFIFTESQTWTIPISGRALIETGGGGGGGYTPGPSDYSYGAGGGGGYSVAEMVLTAGTSAQIIVGNGGYAGYSHNPATSGGFSSFNGMVGSGGGSAGHKGESSFTDAPGGSGSYSGGTGPGGRGGGGGGAGSQGVGGRGHTSSTVVGGKFNYAGGSSGGGTKINNIITGVTPPGVSVGSEVILGGNAGVAGGGGPSHHESAASGGRGSVVVTYLLDGE